jgi:plastocyanin
MKMEETSDQNKLENKENTARTSKKLHGILTVLIILAVAGLTLLVLASDKKQDQNTTSTQQNATDVAVIEIAADGFNPQTLQVKKNTTVVWRNIDEKLHQIAADPFKTHESNPELVAPEALEPNDSYSFTFEKTGSFGYHDNLNPDSLKGTVIVVD